VQSQRTGRFKIGGGLRLTVDRAFVVGFSAIRFWKVVAVFGLGNPGSGEPIRWRVCASASAFLESGQG